MKSALAVSALLLIGCDASSEDTRGTIEVLIPAATSADIKACFGVVVRDADGVTVERQDSVCSLGEPLSVSVRCDEGETYETDVWAIGISDATTGLAYELQNPCPEDAPCTKSVTCSGRVAIDQLEFDLTLMRESNMGFFDFKLLPNLPAETTEVCYALRVSDAGGHVVWTEDSICASRFGSAHDGEVDFVGVCATDSAAGMTENNTAHLWITSVTWKDGEPEGWTNPCPPGVGFVETWTGECSMVGLCTVNADTYLKFEL